MKFKLDENFGLQCREVLSAAGHDITTVADQRMSGAADADLLEACRRKQRCLLTLDLDFANPLRFPPADSSGIAVVRLPGRASYVGLVSAVQTLAKAVESESIVGKLWIVEVGRIRIHQDESQDAL
jgi:predicted nuclease of predicted toxin-antitoxin system